MRPFSSIRTLPIASLVVGALGLAGCDSTPHDPYKNMPMIAPEEVARAAAPVEVDPVLQAEKEYNAQFTRPKP
jgi:hypothetical protein